MASLPATVLIILHLVLLVCFCTGDEKSCPKQVKDHPNHTIIGVFEDKCVEFVPTKVFWSEAKKDCESRNGQLLEIKSQEMQDSVYRAARRDAWETEGVWLGIDDQNKESFWVYSSSGNPIVYTKWAMGQPTCFLADPSLCLEDCGMMNMEYGEWNAEYCHLENHRHTYICEYDAVLIHVTTQPTTASLSTTPAAQPAATWNFHNTRQQFVNVKAYWPDAKRDCESRGAHLLAIKSQAMQDFIHTKMVSFAQTAIWMGITYRERDSKWIYGDSGVPVAYTNWAKDQPTCPLTDSIIRLCDEDCAVMDMDQSGHWDDRYCELVNHKYAYICEYDTSVTPILQRKRDMGKPSFPWSMLHR